MMVEVPTSVPGVNTPPVMVMVMVVMVVMVIVIPRGLSEGHKI
jgi:hypothetical protein